MLKVDCGREENALRNQHMAFSSASLRPTWANEEEENKKMIKRGREFIVL